MYHALKELLNFRKFDLYCMNWQMDDGFDNMIVSGAPYGGPIAVVRDRKHYVRIMPSSKPVISIYNCVGDVISKILVSFHNFFMTCTLLYTTCFDTLLLQVNCVKTEGNYLQ